MLVHHSSTDYAAAASDAAAHARTKLESLIETGRTRAAAVIEQVQRQLPVDRISPAPLVKFTANGHVGLDLGGGPITVHDHALSQVCARTDVPFGYIQRLRGTDWGRQLIARNLNDNLAAQTGSRYLLRMVPQTDGLELRGFLSDRYRRLDSRPIIDAFCKAANTVGALPIEGYALETRVAIKAIIPTVFEPVPNEVMAFGVILSNSDFGDGALSLRAFMLRLWCTNYAITDEALRQVHLGGVLPAEVQFSDRTYRFDTARSVSMVSDLVRSEIGPDRVAASCDAIRRANEQNVDASKVTAFLKKHLGIGDATDVTNAFTSADVQNLPPGQTAWRLSNAISWIAGNTPNEAKRLDMMKVAGLALQR